ATVQGWVTAFNAGSGTDEAGQTVQAYHVTGVSNPALFATAPAVDNGGNLKYTLAPNVSGASTFTVTVQDNGGTANGGRAPSHLTRTLGTRPPPSAARAPPVVNETAGAQTVANGAANFPPAPPNDNGQGVLAYRVTAVSNPGLFTAGPSIAPDGTLTYTPAP